VVTGRLLRVAEGLLDAAGQAAAEQAWDRVLDLAEDVLAIEPDNQDATVLRQLAERHLGRAIPAAGRRQVTVLFADLVGSTAMGERLDPEAYLEVVRAYESACRPMIDRYGGHVNRFAGDGLIAFFGYPHAHEDDALRATRAGLAVLGALAPVAVGARAEHGIELSARLGIHTGLVVIGDRGGGAWRLVDDAFGPTVNMAARLQGVARPNTLVVSDVVAGLLGDRADLKPQGTHHLAGVDRPVEVFEVVAAEGRDPATAATRSALVGRAAELRDLTDRLARARQEPGAAGRVVLLRGDAGVGKSRLLAELMAVVDADGDGGTVELPCSAHLTTSALHPVRRAINGYGGISADTPVDAHIDTLVDLADEVGLDPATTVPLLAIPMGLDVSGRFEPLRLDARQLKESVLGVVVTILAELTASGRLRLLAVEDVQWADPTTIELLDRLVASPPAGLVLVLTTRPTTTWPPAGAAVEVVDLAPLAPADSLRLAGTLAGGRLDDEALAEVARRSDGVPLYVDQLVAVLAGAEGPAAPVDIPLPLMELLQSRLDAVGSAKPIAQVAATLGREFDLAILRRVVASLAEAGDLRSARAGTVDADVGRLVSSHLVEADPRDPGRLRFRHELVRDAAYGSQLHRVRAVRHSATAGVLTALDAGGTPIDAALTAYHHDRAGEAGPAVTAYLVAAERAGRSGAFDEALAHVARADALLPALGDADARRAELRVRLARGSLSCNVAGWAAEGVMGDYARVLDLCSATSPDEAADADLGGECLRALIGTWAWYCSAGEIRELGRLVDAIEHQHARTPMAGGTPVIASCRGTQAYYEGRHVESRALLEAAVAGFATDDLDDWSLWPLPNDPMAAACGFLGALLVVLGDEAGAVAAASAGVERSRSLGFPHGPFSEAYVRSYEGWAHRVRGDIDSAQHAAAAVQRIGSEHGFIFWLIVGQVMDHAAQVAAGAGDSALDGLAAALAAYRAMGVHAMVPSFLAELAEGLLAAGEPEPAGRCVDDLLTFDQQPYMRAEGLRLRAEVRAATGGTDAAAAVRRDLAEAARLAEAQGAPLWMARVAASEVRLLDAAPVAGPGGAGAAGGAG
jgi:class 3 adenylate cyclase